MRFSKKYKSNSNSNSNIRTNLNKFKFLPIKSLVTEPNSIDDSNNIKTNVKPIFKYLLNKSFYNKNYKNKSEKKNYKSNTNTNVNTNIINLFKLFKNNYLNYDGTLTSNDTLLFNIIIKSSVLFNVSKNKFKKICFLPFYDIILNKTNTFNFKINLNYDLYIISLTIQNLYYHSIVIIYDKKQNILYYFDPLFKKLSDNFYILVNYLEFLFKKRIIIYYMFSYIQNTNNINILKKYTNMKLNNSFCSIWCIFFTECIIYNIFNLNNNKSRIIDEYNIIYDVDDYLYEIISKIIRDDKFYPLFPLIYLGFIANKYIRKYIKNDIIKFAK